MEIDQAKDLYFELVNSFGGRENEGQAKAWIKYLPRQDLLMAKKTVTFFVYDSGDTFMPNIPQFNQRLKQFQIQLSQQEAAKIDSAACRKCDGLTWTEDVEDSYIPCEQCRIASHTRWAEGSYKAGVLDNLDEQEGPKNGGYPIAAKASYKPSKPVSKTRARQWRDHIANRTNFVYPEDVPEELDEEEFFEEIDPKLLDW